MYSSVLSATISGVEGVPVLVEADVSNGLPVFSMVGYLSSRVREAQERVWTALRNMGLSFPPKRITVNLSPADIRKEGTRFDLPIAAALLGAFGYLKSEKFKGVCMAGELGLNGEIKGVRGILPIVEAAIKNGCWLCIIPAANLSETREVGEIRILGVKSLWEFYEQAKVDNWEIMDKKEIRVNIRDDEKDEKTEWTDEEEYQEDFSDIWGQEAAKRAGIIAAAGFHNILFIGTKGAGKTMIATRLPSLFPPLDKEEQMEVSRIYSVAGLLGKNRSMIRTRPFRNPHHTATAKAMAGGGAYPLPGEITLAHKGILFLDELPEFSRSALEILRQPMEQGKIYISRVHGNYEFPADFLLIAAMNPCPCGYYPDRNRCSCTRHQVESYLGKISGPLLDRFDICTEMGEVPGEKIRRGKSGKTSKEIRKDVLRVHEIQKDRFAGTKIRFNSRLSGKEAEKYCIMDQDAGRLLEKVYAKMGLSVRGYYKILKTARTIADLDGSEKIRENHISEAVCYRAIDKKYWK